MTDKLEIKIVKTTSVVSMLQNEALKINLNKFVVLDMAMRVTVV